MAAQAAPVVNQVVEGMPELGPEGPDQARVEEARQEADAVQEDVPQLLPRSPAFASWLSAQQDGGAGPPVEEQRALVQELEGGREEVAQPVPAKPGLLSRAASSVKGFFGGVASSIGSKLSGWSSSIKEAFSRENRRDVGAKAPTGGTVAAGLTAHMDNPLTEVTAHSAGGATAAGEVREAGGQATPPTLEHPGEFAHSFASGTFELVHQVAGLAGIFFSALKAALDIRSLVSSIRVLRALKQAKKDAMERAQEFFGADLNQEVVDMVDYAIRQKYEKIIKRAIGSALALAALGTALAILIANPVGAPLAAGIIAGLSISTFVYKIGRKYWKKWFTNSLGKKRADIATELQRQAALNDPLAIDAIRALHLDPDVVAHAPNGPELIMRKLKSA
jgi:hypothetical protein